MTQQVQPVQTTDSFFILEALAAGFFLSWIGCGSWFRFIVMIIPCAIGFTIFIGCWALISKLFINGKFDAGGRGFIWLFIIVIWVLALFEHPTAVEQRIEQAVKKIEAPAERTPKVSHSAYEASRSDDCEARAKEAYQKCYDFWAMPFTIQGVTPPEHRHREYYLKCHDKYSETLRQCQRFGN